MRPIIVRGNHIVKDGDTYIIRKNMYSNKVVKTHDGFKCDCREFYEKHFCKHVRWVTNMNYSRIESEDNITQFLYEEYMEKQLENVDNPLARYILHVDSLQEIIKDDADCVLGKIFSEDDGSFITVLVRKPYMEHALKILLTEMSCPTEEDFYSIYNTQSLCPGICINCLAIKQVEKEVVKGTCLVCGRSTLYSGINLILREV